MNPEEHKNIRFGNNLFALRDPYFISLLLDSNQYKIDFNFWIGDHIKDIETNNHYVILLHSAN